MIRAPTPRKRNHVPACWTKYKSRIYIHCKIQKCCQFSLVKIVQFCTTSERFFELLCKAFAFKITYQCGIFSCFMVFLPKCRNKAVYKKNKRLPIKIIVNGECFCHVKFRYCIVREFPVLPDILNQMTERLRGFVPNR